MKQKCNRLTQFAFAALTSVLIFLLAFFDFRNKDNVKTLALCALLLSITLTALGGLMDIADEKRIGYITKKHAWHDGMYLAIVTVALLLLAM